MPLLNIGYYNDGPMPKTKTRLYKSLVRQRQAGDTRRRIVEATRRLLQSEGYAGMTIEAIAARAEVSAQSVYAIFKSKTGILMELLDQSTFGPEYEDAVRQALNASEQETRLRIAARIARQIHDAQSATFDLLRGAGVVAPELAKLEQQRESLRYERQERMIISLHEAGKLRPGLDKRTARDIFWMLTGRDVYRMLVRERGWSPQKYQDWLAEALVQSLLARGRTNPARTRTAKSISSPGHVD
jgi:AcrR family transcriptional regulator